MDAPALPPRVAFGGRMQVGKTSAADHLVAGHGYVKVAFADPIKAIAREAFGWDGRKDAAGRRLLQEIGTVGRRYHSDLWIDRLSARLAARSPARVVVDDLRLAREVAALERLGFACVRIERPAERIAAAAAAAWAHETETELEALDLPVVHNDASLAELYARVDALLVRIAAPGKPEGPARERGLRRLGQEETRA